jgi:hypothetical protein
MKKIIKKLNHLMLDLETMGNSSNSAILSIGAVEFDLESGEIGREFYQKINLQSCLNAGLIVNGSTVMWWLQQSEVARKEVCKVGDNLYNSLSKLTTFMRCLESDFQLWGNGARFDIGILEDAYFACKIEILPWNFRSERDVRTLVSFAPEIKEGYPFTGTEHNPIDDCKHQIGYCSAIWRKLNNL